jgi:hypothetical protein
LGQTKIIISFLLFLSEVVIDYAAYSSRNAIIRANSPIASVRANPKIVYENNCGLNEGFLEVELIKAANTSPIPTPAPASPIVANPDPIILAAANIFLFLPIQSI